MAWIQIHQHLRDHRKLLSAADELDIDPVCMLGHMVSIWLWAIDNAPSGSLAGVSPRIIARAAQWGGAPDDLVAALIHAGWIDDDATGLSIHDWYGYTGRLINQREAERDRSRRRRETASRPADDRRETDDRPADDRRETDDRPADDQQTTGGRPADDRRQTRVDKSRVDKSRVDQTFETFWAAYPRHVAKQAARRAWARLAPDDDLVARILAAVRRATMSLQWQRDGGRYIPHPATWITQGRWDDDLDDHRQVVDPCDKREMEMMMQFVDRL